MLNSILSDSKNQLRNNWMVAIATVLVYGILTAVCTSFVLGILVMGHLSVGIAMWSLMSHGVKRLEWSHYLVVFKTL